MLSQGNPQLPTFSRKHKSGNYDEVSNDLQQKLNEMIKNREDNILLKLYDEKSKTYFKTSDFNSLTKLEKTRLKFMKFNKFYKRCKTLSNGSKPNHSNNLSLSGIKMYTNLPSVDVMNKTFDNMALVNIKCENHISYQEQRDSSHFKRK